MRRDDVMPSLSVAYRDSEKAVTDAPVTASHARNTVSQKGRSR